MVGYSYWLLLAACKNALYHRLMPLAKRMALILVLAALPSVTPLYTSAEPPDAIATALERTRQDLAANKELEARATAALKALRQDSSATADVIGDYEAYLSRVQAMVAENRRLVAQLEALQRQYAGQARLSANDDPQALINEPIPEAGVRDAVADLDRELDASLAEFDELLLAELKLIRERSAPKLASLAQEASAAAERLRQKGIDIDADPSGMETEAEASREQPPSQPPSQGSAAAGVPERDSGSPASPGSRDVEGVAGDRQSPGGRYDGSDDDIVARQLREAAEQETDPVLREKLWREYEAYKRGSQ